MTLEYLHRNQLGEIVRLRGHGPIRARLMDMGLVEGTVVEMIRRAPLGGPFEIKVRGTLVSLRPEEARMIVVKPLRRRRGERHGRHRRGRHKGFGGFLGKFFGHFNDRNNHND